MVLADASKTPLSQTMTITIACFDSDDMVIVMV